MENKSWAVNEVAAPEFLRFLSKPIGPLESHRAYPFRASLDGAGDERERCPYADGYRHLQARQTLVDPAVLTRRAESYPKDIRAGGIDAVDCVLIFLHGERAEGRRERA